jgi:hypothetical protein
MASSRSIEAETEQTTLAGGLADQGSFGAEFRELARQRRFVRTDDAGDSVASSWREEAAPPSSAARQRALADAVQVPQPAPASPAPTRTATAADPTPPAAPAPTTPAVRTRAPRISEDQRATLLELARMSDRLVESREALATATARVAQLESGLAAANDRVLASRVLVQDAQRATRELSERAAFLEGRCEMLQEALELAVNASFLTRRRWRREQRARVASSR